jgi:hypothetical protein
VVKVEKLRHRADGFRIGAPEASQRAAFEEDGGPDAGAIADGESLYIEHAAYDFGLRADFGFAQ